ncbi:MAG: GNAT family N-acetyltransferase [Proteobacteria bacterium]|nr:MAG: GNAT family N-acetyltransferase [Pseudomonadota bacterium]
MPNPTPPCTLRFATADDAETIHQLVCELAIYEREPSAVTATVEDVRQAGFGPNPAFEVLLAEVEGEVAGFALFFSTFSTWTGKRNLYLEDLFVRRKLRGRGVGKALLAALAKLCVSRGWERYEWQVLDWNEPAISFYEALGARPRRNWIPFRIAGHALSRLAKHAPLIPRSTSARGAGGSGGDELL